MRVFPPGKGICHQVNLEYLSTVVAVARQGREALRLPRHRRRDRLPHADGQRPWGPGLGGGRDGGRGGDARRAVPHPNPPRGGREAQGRAPGGGDHHRPRAGRHGAPEEQERRRRFRRVLRGGVPAALRPRPGDPGEHVPRVRRHRGILAGGQGHLALSPRHGKGRGLRQDGRGVLQAAGALPHARVASTPVTRRSSRWTWPRSSRPSQARGTRRRGAR